ncbi:MAG: LamG domain-containing protein, partial [Armatimonadota bacterium]
TLGGDDGAGPEWVDGIRGKALKFAEAKHPYVIVKDAGSLVGPGPFTVMAWIKPVGRRKTMEIVCHKGDTSNKGFRLRNFWSRLAFEIGTGGDSIRVRAPEWSLEHGFWQHVAATYDGERVRLYVNAVLVAEAKAPTPPTPESRPLVIGNYIGRKDAYPFEGVIDEVALYDSALAAEDILHAAAGK